MSEMSDNRPMNETPDKAAQKQELTKELRSARNWILGVGIMMFVVDQIMTRLVYGDRLSSEWQTKLLIIDLVVLAYFVGLYFMAASRPKPACILALIGFWGLQVGVALWSGDPASLAKGILVKVLFTMALVRGLKSASRASDLQAHLADVFD
jgi:hypothetical protein